MIAFSRAFQALTGNPPFPWQTALYERFFSDRVDNIPRSCNLPTGLGKTSVIPIWLIALANYPSKMPRRLVYVVNRRTVVDQTTNEVEKIADNADSAGVPRPAISTLRGQFADNREWSADPSRPAVICGTVDMIGSRLLFSGYGVGFKGKPLHAGFLGQDVLLVHDEAHLEPAFQKLIEAIQKEQRDWELNRPFRVLELTATSRANEASFELTPAEMSPPDQLPEITEQPVPPLHVVWQRIKAKKALNLIPVGDNKQALAKIIALAEGYKDSGQAVLIFVRTVDAVGEVRKALNGKVKAQTPNVTVLTGTLRGLERDKMADPRHEGADPIFARFLKPPKKSKSGETIDEKEKWKIVAQAGTVFLICTSAGEVGIDISADHLISDLMPFDSMAQRFGRVNRYGTGDSKLDVVYTEGLPSEAEIAAERKKEKPKAEVIFDGMRRRSLDLLESVNGDASPLALGKLPSEARIAAFSPQPEILPVSDILFDAWALTTIKGKLPGRPPVEPYLHGVEDEKTFDTEFAWREEVELLTGKLRNDEIADWMDEFPLKPHEILRVPTFGKRRAYEHLELIAARTPEVPAWVIEPDGELTAYVHLSELMAKKGTDYVVSVASRTVVLPPKAGGLTKIGTLDGDTARTDAISYDVAGMPSSNVQPLLRLKVISDDGEASFKLVAPINGWPADFTLEYRSDQDRWKVLNDYLKSLNLSPVKPALRFDLTTDSGDDASPAGAATEYLVVRPVSTKKVEMGESEWPSLDSHLTGVRQFAEGICKQLKLDTTLAGAVSLAAAWHDLGKGRSIWQRGAGNNPANSPVAKTLHGRPPENLNHFRHELGSLVDVVAMPKFADEFHVLEPEQQELVLHLIATHHGRGRPHFPMDEAYDQERTSSLIDGVVREVPGRFAKLLRKYGRWGLSYLESLLRAADALESRRIGAAPISPPVGGSWPERALKLLPFAASPCPKPSITVAVDPTNPGQFFACCGLLELADRLWTGAEGWFEKGEFSIACEGTLNKVLNALVDCHLTNTMTVAQHTRFNEISAMSVKVRKSTPGVEDEYKALDKLLREANIVLRDPFHITLDWFADDYAGGSRFKTWAGRQSVLDIATSMKDALKNSAWRNEECLTFSVTGCGLPFNFDSDLGGQGSALDVGFSFDPLNSSDLTRIESSARPFLELLAFVGLQRFRPRPVEKENRYIYCAWNRPLSTAIAAPAACGMLPMPKSPLFEFRLLYRTDYLKSFLPAIPLTRGTDE